MTLPHGAVGAEAPASTIAPRNPACRPTPTPADLARNDPGLALRAYEASQRLAEMLEMLGLAQEVVQVRRIRGTVWLAILGPDADAVCVCGVVGAFGRHEPCGRAGSPDGFCHTRDCHPFEAAAR